MNRCMRTKLAAAALVPTGVVGVFGVGGPLLLRSQAGRARREITELADGQTWPAAARGVAVGEGTPLRLVILGDSSAVGLGADGPEDTAGLRVLRRLAADGQAATLDVVAVSGAVATDLDDQVSEALTLSPQLAVISIGANDIAKRIAPRVTAKALGAAVERLRAEGVEVVVATAPDLGAVMRLGRPLRWVAGLASRRTWNAQERAATTAGALVVPVGKLIGPLFAQDPSLFSADGFHPSSAGYALIVEELWPVIREAAAKIAAEALLS